MSFRNLRQIGLHLLLFLITLLTTTLAGAEWVANRSLFYSAEGFGYHGWLNRAELQAGLLFAVPFLGVLTVHEFGHYFAARHHKVRVTLPFYIPFYLGLVQTIGTMGAFIRIRSRVFSRKEYFDIGLAGPLAGFLVAVPLLVYAFTHLPPPEYIYTIHPEYKQFGLDYAEVVYRSNGVPNLALGKNLLFWIMEHTLVQDPALIPNRYELMHYPLLFAGYLALFFTALNLLPIGQLDGGHIGYSLLGYRHFNRLSAVAFVGMITYAGMGLVSEEMLTEDYGLYFGLYGLYLLVVLRRVVPTLGQTVALALGVLAVQFGLNLLFPNTQTFPGWLAFALILSRVLGIYHPPAPNEEPLSLGRVALGLFALLMLVLCFSPAPFSFE